MYRLQQKAPKARRIVCNKEVGDFDLINAYFNAESFVPCSDPKRKEEYIFLFSNSLSQNTWLDLLVLVLIKDFQYLADKK